MEKQVNDFNYQKSGNEYIFFILRENKELDLVGSTTEPLLIMKELALQGYRYNPSL